MCEGTFHLVIVKIGPQAVLREFHLDEVIDRIGRVHGLVNTRANLRVVPVGRFPENLEVIIRRQGVFQFVNVDRDDGNRILGDTRIQQVVPEAKVEKFPLPDNLFVHHRFLVDDDVGGTQILGGFVFPLRGFICNERPTAFARNAHGQRPDLTDSCAIDIDEKDELTGNQFLVGR